MGGLLSGTQDAGMQNSGLSPQLQQGMSSGADTTGGLGPLLTIASIAAPFLAPAAGAGSAAAADTGAAASGSGALGSTGVAGASSIPAQFPTLEASGAAGTAGGSQVAAGGYMQNPTMPTLEQAGTLSPFASALQQYNEFMQSPPMRAYNMMRTLSSMTEPPPVTQVPMGQGGTTRVPRRQIRF